LGNLGEFEWVAGNWFGFCADNLDSCFFLYGGTDPAVWDKAKKEERLAEDVPGNHSPFFAPVVWPTLRVGCEGYVVAALTFLRGEEEQV
jgi:hypothetical protein